jgi:hypothetical protein
MMLKRRLENVSFDETFADLTCREPRGSGILIIKSPRGSGVMSRFLVNFRNKLIQFLFDDVCDMSSRSYDVKKAISNNLFRSRPSRIYRVENCAGLV